MSYTDDCMSNLYYALRSTKPLQRELTNFNANIAVFERLATAIERQNELKAIELGLEKPQQEQPVIEEKGSRLTLYPRLK